jgi:hypothetical protein
MQQSAHIAYLVSRLARSGRPRCGTHGGCRSRVAAYPRRVERRPHPLHRGLRARLLQQRGPSRRRPGWFGGNYGGGGPASFRLLRDWRERDDLEGLALTES